MEFYNGIISKNDLNKLIVPKYQTVLFICLGIR